MYSQEIIDTVGEKFFESIILGKNNYTFNITKDEFIDKRLYYAFQHYLVKCFKTNTHKEECRKYIIAMYSDFMKYPYEFSKSPLLNSTNLNIIFGNHKYNKMILDIRDKYYNGKTAHTLYETKKNRNLTEDEKNQYYSYLITHLSKKDSKLKEVIEEEISKIIDDNKQVSELNKTELQFYLQYVANYALENRNIQTIVMIGKAENAHGVNCGNITLINKKAKDFDIVLATKTVCHESRHAYQIEASAKETSTVAFETAQRLLFSKYLNTEDYDSYHDNYRHSKIELDAERDGHFKASVFFRMHNRHDLAEKVRQNRIDKLDKRDYYAYMIGKDKKPYPIDSFIVTNMDAIIKAYPDELKNFPVLKHMYKEDGTKKDFLELLKQSTDEYLYTRDLSTNYINYGIMNNELNKIDLTKLNKEEANKITKSLASRYRDKMILLSDYYEDIPNLSELDENRRNFAKKRIEKTTIYELHIAQKILSYANDNCDLMISNLDEKISNTSYIYNFIYDLRDFNKNNIKNEYIRNNPNIMAEIDKLNKIYKEVLQKFNKAYALDRLNRLNEEEKNSIIKLKNDEEITVENFIKKYAIPAMNANQKISIKGKEIYISELINNYKKKKENKELLDMFKDKNPNENQDIKLTQI